LGYNSYPGGKMSKTTTVILGGGFGGISAANALRQLLTAGHEIVVIDESSRFHVGAGKTWIMLGERTYDQVSQSRVALLAPGIRFVEAKIQSIGLSNRTVSLESGSLNWDFLVIALGADLNPAKVPGLAEATHTFYTVEGAQRLKVVLERFSGGDLAILIPKVPFKCPPAPYEAALLLHHAFERRGLAGKVRLAIYTAEGAPMATAGPEMGQYIKEELAQRAIAFFPQRSTSRVDGSAQSVVFEDGSEARYDLLIAIPPHEAPQVVRDAQLTNQSGWIPVDPRTLQVKQPPDTRDVYVDRRCYDRSVARSLQAGHRVVAAEGGGVRRGAWPDRRTPDRRKNTGPNARRGLRREGILLSGNRRTSRSEGRRFIFRTAASSHAKADSGRSAIPRQARLGRTPPAPDPVKVSGPTVVQQTSQGAPPNLIP
jgi:sulfide:quinone oxidoreductase